MNGPTEESRCFDNTKLSGYKGCPRYHFIRQILGWKKVGTAAPLVFGGAWHNGQDKIWEHAKNLNAQQLAELGFMAFTEKWEADDFPSDMGLEENERLSPRTPMIAYEMYHEYVSARWKMLQEANVLAIEQPFAIPMPGTENFWYVGRLDKVVEYNAQRLVIEHKTTTAYATIGNFRSDYIESWYSDSQVKGYQFGAGIYFEGLDGVWVDAALVHKKIHNAFRFVPVAHALPILTEWLGDAVEWTNRVAAEEDQFKQDGHLRPGAFPKNENSCFGKYGACAFVDICRTVADPSKLDGPPEGFIVEYWNPFDVLQLDKIVNEPGE
jgi:hypothetical protein